MPRIMRLLAAVVLIAFVLISGAVADEAAFTPPIESITPSEECPPEAPPDEGAGEMPPVEATDEIPPVEPTDDADVAPDEGCVSESVDPAVPEVEYAFGEEASSVLSDETDVVTEETGAEPDAPFNEEIEPTTDVDVPDASEAVQASAEVVPDAAEDAQVSAKAVFEGEAVPAPPETDVTAFPQAICLGIREGFALPIVNPTEGWLFVSSNEKIATVGADGVIWARKRGSAKILFSNDTSVFECAVKVLNAPKRIQFPKKRVTLLYDPASGTGEQARLKPRLSHGSSSRIEYYGYDENVVSVSADGTVTAVGVGATRVKARTFNNKSAEIKITVANATNRTMLVAHRGSAHWGENTLAAFQNFPSTGADAVELDARSCSDGTQVIFHDAVIQADGTTFNVADLTLDQLRAINPSICTLDEALDVLASTGKGVFLELKETADGSKCVASVQAHGLQSNTVFFSFFEAPLAQVYKAQPSAVLGLSLTARENPFSRALMEKAQRLHINFFMANRKLMSRKVVNYLHGKGYTVFVWTVNDGKRMRALYQMGVDGILTDYPERGLRAKRG